MFKSFKNYNQKDVDLVAKPIYISKEKLTQETKPTKIECSLLILSKVHCSSPCLV